MVNARHVCYRFTLAPTSSRPSRIVDSCELSSVEPLTLDPQLDLELIGVAEDVAASFLMTRGPTRPHAAMLSRSMPVITRSKRGTEGTDRYIVGGLLLFFIGRALARILHKSHRLRPKTWFDEPAAD